MLSDALGDSERGGARREVGVATGFCETSVGVTAGTGGGDWPPSSRITPTGRIIGPPKVMRLPASKTSTEGLGGFSTGATNVVSVAQ